MAGFSRLDHCIYTIYAWFCRSRGAPFNLSGLRKRPVRLLICLPSSPEEARKAVKIIPELVSGLGAESVTVIGEPRSVEYCDLADERIRVAPLDRTARWWFGLPSFELSDRLSEERFSLAVDLNPRAELLPAVLCLSTGAPIRLCLDDPQRTRLFNVRVQLAEENGTGGNGDADPLANEDPARPGPSPRGPGPSPRRVGASSGNSPYARLLRVVQAAVGSASRPEFQLDSTPRSRDI